VTTAAVPTPVPARGHHLPAAGVVAAAVLLLVGLPHLLGDAGRLTAVLLVQLALVVAWVVVTGVEGFAGSVAVGALAAGAADLVLMLPGHPSLGGLVAVLGVGFLALVLQQMLRRPRPAVVASLSGGVLLLCAVCALSVLLLQGRSALGPQQGTSGVLAVGAALVAGHLVDLVLPRPRVADGVPRGLAGLVLSVLVAVGVALGRRGASPGGPHLPWPVPALLFGAALGVVAALGGVAASYLSVESPAEGAGPARAWALPVVQAVLPLAVCAPIALALQTVL
jgi:hypothetical protein